MAKVLIVDDEESVAQVIELALQAWGGHEVLKACDGLEALSVVPTEQPDLVIMDIMMPQMNGADCALRLRELQPDTPIVVISGYWDAANRGEFEQMGCAAYFTKPMSLKVLCAAVNKILGVAQPQGD